METPYGGNTSPVKALTAAGAGAILDALGRWWKPWLHPRDRNGRFIHTLSTIKVSLARGGSGDDMTAEIEFVDPETSAVYAKIQQVLSPEAKNKNFAPGDMVLLPKENFEVLPAKARIKTGARKTPVKVSRNDARKLDKLIDDLRTDSKNRDSVPVEVFSAATEFARAFDKYLESTSGMPDGGTVSDERYIQATVDFSESIDNLLNTLDEVRGAGRSPGDRRTPGQDDSYGTMIDDKINTLMTVQRLIEGEQRVKGRFSRVGQAQAETGAGDESIPEELKALIESSSSGAGPQFKDVNGNDIPNPILEAVKAQARIDAQAGKTTLTPEEYAMQYVAGGGLATNPELSGVTQLAPISTRGTELVAARRSLDGEGNPVSTGDIVVVEAYRDRPALTGVVMAFGKSKGRDFIKVRAFDTEGKKNDYRIYNTSKLRVTTPEGASQAEILAGVAEEGIDYSESQRNLIDRIAQHGGRRLAGQGAGRTSETSRGGTSVLDRKKKDANGRLIGVGDWVRDISSGNIGRVEYVEEGSNTVRVAFEGASTEKARKVSSNFELISGANGWDYNRGDVDNVAGTGVFAPTRQEAASLARSYDLINAADAIERGGDKNEIQAALAKDEQWVYIAPELARAKAELVDQARRGIATGPANDVQATLLQDGQILGAAFEGQFSDGEIPEPEAPRIITPTPPKNAPESAIPSQVYKNVPDGSIVVANPEDQDSIYVVNPDRTASEYRRDSETGDFVDMGPLKRSTPNPRTQKPAKAEEYAAREKAARDSISELLGIDATGMTRDEISNTPEMLELVDKLSAGDKTIIDKVNRVAADFREISMAEKLKENGPAEESAVSTPTAEPTPAPEAPAEKSKPTKPTNIDTTVAEKFTAKLESDIFDLAENGIITPKTTQDALERLRNLDESIQTGKEDVFNEAARKLARTPGLPEAMSKAIDDFIARKIESGGIFKGTRVAEPAAPVAGKLKYHLGYSRRYTPAYNVPDNLRGYVDGINKIMDSLKAVNDKFLDSIMDDESLIRFKKALMSDIDELLWAYSKMQEVFNNPDATDQRKQDAVIFVLTNLAEAIYPGDSVLGTYVRNAAEQLKSRYNIDEKATEIVGPDAAADARETPLSETITQEPSTDIVDDNGVVVSTGFVAELKESRLPVPEDGLTADEVNEYFDKAVLAHLNETDGAALIIRTDENGNTVLSVGVITPDEATAAGIAQLNDDVYYDAVAGEWKLGTDFTAPEEPASAPENIEYKSDLSGLNLEDVNPAFDSSSEDIKSAWEDLKAGDSVSDEALQDIVDVLTADRAEWIDASNDPIGGEEAKQVVDVIDTVLDRISSRTGVSAPREVSKTPEPEVVDTTPEPEVVDTTPGEEEVVAPAEPDAADLVDEPTVDTADDELTGGPSGESYTDREDWYQIFDDSEAPGDAADRFMLGEQITPEERQQLIDAVQALADELRDAIDSSEYDTRQEEEDAKSIIKSANELVNVLQSTARPTEPTDTEEDVVVTGPEPVSVPETVSVSDEPPTPDPTDEASPASAEPDDVPDNTETVDAGPDPYAEEAFPPTDQQRAIIDAVLSGEDTVVRALAGTGKTSTLKLIAKRLLREQPNKKIVYIAFNKSVQTEAEASMPRNVESRTADSIAWRAISTDITGKSRNKEALRLPTLIAENFGITRIKNPTDPTESLSPVDVTRVIQRAINQFAISADDKIGKQHFEFGDDTPQELVDIANKMWADITSPDGKLAVNNAHITKMWALSNPDLSKDGSGLNNPADVIFFDEAQDINPVLAKVVADQSIQKVYVGDENQAIYGFRGAENQLENVSAPNDLPLTKSWRFGPEIAGIGNRFLSLLGAKTRVEGGGPNGTIVEPDSMDNADAVLVRTNGGGLQAIQEELEKGRTVGVSKAYKDELTSLVDTAEWLQGDRQGQRPSKVHEDLLQFKNWDEVLNEVADGSNRKVEMLAKLISSYGVNGLRDLLKNVKIAKTKDDSGAAGGINLDTLVDGGSGSLSNGVDYAVSGEPDNLTVSLSGKTFPVKEDIKQKGFKFSSSTKAWSKSYDSPNAAAADLNSLQGTSSGEQVDVVVTTAHKAKGLEWDNVRIGNDFWGPRRDPTVPGVFVLPSPEELRLAYVAVTRAQKSLDPGSLSWVYNQTDNSDESPNVAEQPEVSAPSGPQVSDEQIQNIIDKAESGYSVNLNTGQDQFDEGFIVSIPGREFETTSDALKSDGRSIIDSYVANNVDELSQESKLLGSWADGSGAVYLDVSEVIATEADAVNAGIDRKQKAIWDAKNKQEIFIGAGDGEDYAPYTTADGAQVGIAKNGEEFIPFAYPNLGSAGVKGEDAARRIDWGGQTFSTLVEALAFAEKQNANSETPAAKPSSSAKKKKAVATNAQISALTDWPTGALSRDRRKAVVDALNGTTPFTEDSLDDAYAWVSQASTQIAERIESNDPEEDIAELKRQLKALARLEAALEKINPEGDGPGPSDGGGGPGPKAPSGPEIPPSSGGEITPAIDLLGGSGILTGSNAGPTLAEPTIEDVLRVFSSVTSDDALKKNADAIGKNVAQTYADAIKEDSEQVEKAVIDKINNGTDNEILSKVLSIFNRQANNIRVNNVTVSQIRSDKDVWHQTDNLAGDIPGMSLSALEDTLSILTENFPVKGRVQITISDDLIKLQEKPSILAYAARQNNFIAMSRKAVTVRGLSESSKLSNTADPVGTNYLLAHEWGHLLDLRSDEAAEEDFAEVKRLIDEEGAVFTKYGMYNAVEAYAEAFTIWFSGDTSNAIASYFANMYGWPMPKKLTSGPVVSAGFPSDRMRKDDNFPVIYDTFLLDPPPTVSYEDTTVSFIPELPDEETNDGEKDGEDDTAQAPGGGERGRFSTESDQGTGGGGSSDERGPSSAGGRRLGNRRIVL